MTNRARLAGRCFVEARYERTDCLRAEGRSNTLETMPQFKVFRICRCADTITDLVKRVHRQCLFVRVGIHNLRGSCVDGRTEKHASVSALVVRISIVLPSRYYRRARTTQSAHCFSSNLVAPFPPRKLGCRNAGRDRRPLRLWGTVVSLTRPPPPHNRTGFRASCSRTGRGLTVNGASLWKVLGHRPATSRQLPGRRPDISAEIPPDKRRHVTG